MSDRLFAVVWLAFCAAVAWLAWKIDAPFSYEPIGPRAFPLLLAGAMAASAAWLIAKPDRGPDWPRGPAPARSRPKGRRRAMSRESPPLVIPAASRLTLG